MSLITEELLINWLTTATLCGPWFGGYFEVDGEDLSNSISGFCLNKATRAFSGHIYSGRHTDENGKLWTRGIYHFPTVGWKVGDVMLVKADSGFRICKNNKLRVRRKEEKPEWCLFTAVTQFERVRGCVGEFDLMEFALKEI